MNTTRNIFDDEESFSSLSSLSASMLPSSTSSMDEEDPLQKLIEEAEIGSGLSISAYVTYYTHENRDFYEAYKKNQWHVALKDSDGDFYLLGTPNSSPTATSVYKPGWYDMGDAKQVMFYALQSEIDGLRRRGSIKGEIEHAVVSKEWHKVFQKVVLFRATEACGYKLEDPTILPSSPARRKSSAALRGRRGIEASRTNDSPGYFQTKILSYLLFSLGIQAPASFVMSQQGTLQILAAGAIVEVDANGFTRVLSSAVGRSMKGRQEIHAEERLLDELWKNYESTMQKRMHGRRLGLYVLMTHARGNEQTGSMCGSCICSLSKFIKKWSALDIELLQVKYPTRRSHQNPEVAVSSTTALNDIIKNPEDNLFNMEYRNCTMNDFQIEGKDLAYVGQDVKTIVQGILNGNILDNSNHWIHCHYPNERCPHNFESRQVHQDEAVATMHHNNDQIHSDRNEIHPPMLEAPRLSHERNVVENDSSSDHFCGITKNNSTGKSSEKKNMKKINNNDRFPSRKARTTTTPWSRERGERFNLPAV